jgi:hypothetical protein
MSLREAATLSGMPLYRVQRLVSLGKVTSLQVPQTRPVIDRQEFLALIESSIRPATTAG